MTDPTDERAERAFRDVLAHQAGTYEPLDLDLTPSAGRHHWRTLGAVAAGAVLVGGTAVGVGLVDRHDAVKGSPTAPTSTTATTSEQGWREESFADVVVEVPDSWGYASSPASDWCASVASRFPTEPYVDTNNGLGGVRAIGCLSISGDPDSLGMQAPEKYWATHVSFRPANRDAPDGTIEQDGWTRIIRTIGHAQVTVLADREHLAAAHRIIDSARVAARDQFGCDATSPVQVGHFPRPPERFDLGQVDRVESIAICQYGLYRPAGYPGLLASRQLTGAAAQSELDALKAAPIGSGPNTPETCLNSMTGDTAMVLRLDTGSATHDVYGYMDWCINNGFDDGTNVRALTKDSCRPLWADRVIMWSGDMTPFAMCHE